MGITVEGGREKEVDIWLDMEMVVVVLLTRR